MHTLHRCSAAMYGPRNFSSDAVIAHDETRPQLVLCRYKKPADWELLSDLAEQHPVPLIGNGDVLTHYEVRSMRLSSPAYLRSAEPKGNP